MSTDDGNCRGQLAPPMNGSEEAGGHKRQNKEFERSISAARPFLASWEITIKRNK